MRFPLDHVAIAAKSFSDIVPLLERLSGLDSSPPERVESQGVEVTFVGNVEVLRPLADDNGVARFIAKRGPGLHHVAYRVKDLEGVMQAMMEDGYRFTSEGPMTGRGGHRIAFVHPASAGGTLVELLEEAEASHDDSSMGPAREERGA